MRHLRPIPPAPGPEGECRLDSSVRRSKKGPARVPHETDSCALLAVFFTSQRFNEYLTASKFNREAKGKAFFRRPMQILAPLRAGPARNRWYPEVRPNPAEDRI